MIFWTWGSKILFDVFSCFLNILEILHCTFEKWFFKLWLIYSGLKFEFYVKFGFFWPGGRPKRSKIGPFGGQNTLRYDMICMVSWYIMIYYCVLWCIILYYEVLWCIMMHYDVLRCIMMYHDVSWCIMMYYDILWRTMIHWDLLGRFFVDN